jgi:hypothetical protein
MKQEAPTSLGGSSSLETYWNVTDNLLKRKDEKHEK